MALSFPSSPNLDQIYSDGTNSWRWTGTAWKKYNPVIFPSGDVSFVNAGSASDTDTEVRVETGPVASLRNVTLVGGYAEEVYAVSDVASVTLSPVNGSIQLWTLGASRTPKVWGWDSGQSITLMIDDGSGFTITWTDISFGPSGVIWESDGGTAPTLATSGYTVVVLWKVGAQIYGARVGNA
jgi:hypothetical protein